MVIKGLPVKFWIVLTPEKTSTIPDIWFECDLLKFANQIRGGLDERTIEGIFAGSAEALEFAQELLERLKEPRKTPSVQFHPSPWPEWYATQDSRTSVSLVDKATGERLTVTPPVDWGRNWAWNLSEDGKGIVICRIG